MTNPTDLIVGWKRMLKSPHFWTGFSQGCIDALVWIAVFTGGVLVGFLWKANL